MKIAPILTTEGLGVGVEEETFAIAADTKRNTQKEFILIIKQINHRQRALCFLLTLILIVFRIRIKEAEIKEDK